MPTTLVPDCRWRWAILSMYCFMVLPVIAGSSAAGRTANLRGEGHKHVRFASPLIQGVFEIPSNEENSAAQPPAAPPSQPRQEILTVIQTMYPVESEDPQTPTNTTVPQSTTNGTYTFVAQAVPPSWRPNNVLPGATTFAISPGMTFSAIPVLPEAPNQGAPSVAPIYSNVPTPHQLIATNILPSMGAPVQQPADAPQSAPAPVMPPAPFMIITHPQAVPATTGTQLESDIWAAPTRHSQLPAAPTFVLPRGKQRLNADIMDEVREQEELKRARNVSPAKSFTIPSSVTKGLAIVGAAVAAKKTAQGLAHLYKWARGIPSGS